ncbi:MAG: hypothetical protein ACK4N5_14990 [Myxococcales bacterium]
MSGRTAAYAAALALLGCGGGALEDRQLVSTSGRLTYQVRAEGYEGSDLLPWNNSGTQAVVDWKGTALTAGSVTLQLVDGAGTPLYEKTATPGSVPAVSTTEVQGVTGDWKATVLFREATGTVALELQGAR